MITGVIDRLAIWLGEDHVADLDLDRRVRLSLRYTSETVLRIGIGGLCLSVGLPVRSTPYGHDSTGAWAEGLLPEGESRTVLERRFAVRRGDTFGLLAAIGRDCAGAVSLLRPGEQPADPTVATEPLDEEGVGRAVDDLAAAPLGASEHVRVSLGGLQAKVLLARTPDGRWAWPSAGAPSTHLLKPDPPQFPGLIAAEAFALNAAQLAGVPTAECELAVIAGRSLLVVRRFDRIDHGDGVVTRLHQEDGCQALGLDPDRQKYQLTPDRPPRLRDLAALLADHGIEPVADRERLLAATAINIAIGNTDAHARNHAFLHDSGGIRLAPLYDAAPTDRFVRTQQAALWVRDQPLLGSVSVEDLVDEAVRWRVRAEIAHDIVTETLERLDEAIDGAASRVRSLDDRIPRDVRRRIRSLLDRAPRLG